MQPALLLLLLSALLSALPARAQTCGTKAVAGENDNADGGRTTRESRMVDGVCEACPAGQLGTNPEDDCQACGVYYDPFLGPHFRGAWGACTGCPIGSYAATINDDCMNCGDYDNPSTNPPGGTTDGANATSVAECMCGPGKMYEP